MEKSRPTIFTSQDHRGVSRLFVLLPSADGKMVRGKDIILGASPDQSRLFGDDDLPGAPSFLLLPSARCTVSRAGRQVFTGSPFGVAIFFVLHFAAASPFIATTSTTPATKTAP